MVLLNEWCEVCSLSPCLRQEWKDWHILMSCLILISVFGKSCLANISLSISAGLVRLAITQDLIFLSACPLFSSRLIVLLLIRKSISSLREHIKKVTWFLSQSLLLFRSLRDFLGITMTRIWSQTTQEPRLTSDTRTQPSNPWFVARCDPRPSQPPTP